MAYTADKIKDGYKRPFGGPHLWISEQMKPNKEESLQFKWDQAVDICRFEITFNDDVNEDLINLHHRTSFEIIPEC